MSPFFVLLDDDGQIYLVFTADNGIRYRISIEEFPVVEKPSDES